MSTRPLHVAAGSEQSPAAQRQVGPSEVSRAVAALTGGAGGGAGSEAVQAIRALPAEQKVALIAAYQFIGARPSQSPGPQSPKLRWP